MNNGIHTNRIMKRTILAVFGLLLLAGPEAARAQFTYTTNADGVTLAITGYTGSGGTVVIPSAIHSMTVTSIGEGAFAGCSCPFSMLTLPASVASIGVGRISGGHKSRNCLGTHLGLGSVFGALRKTGVAFKVP